MGNAVEGGRFNATVHRTPKVVGVHRPNDSTTSGKQRIATLISGSVKGFIRPGYSDIIYGVEKQVRKH